MSDVESRALFGIEGRGVKVSPAGEFLSENGQAPVIAAARRREDAKPCGAMREIEAEVFKFRSQDPVLVIFQRGIGVVVRGGHVGYVVFVGLR